MRRANTGATLIELVSIMFIIASVATSAVPAWGDLRSFARQRVMSDLMAKAQYEAEASRVYFAAAGGDLNAASATVAINGNSVSFQYGYPKDDATGIARLMTFNGSLSFAGYTGWSISSTIADCYVRYYAPSMLGSSATLLSVQSGC